MMADDSRQPDAGKKPVFDVLIAQPRSAQQGQQQKSDFFNVGTVFESEKSRPGERTFSGPSAFGGRLVIKERQPKIEDGQNRDRDEPTRSR